jgi:hypothetical protein
MRHLAIALVALAAAPALAQPHARPLPPPCEPSAPSPRTTVSPKPPAPLPCQPAPR